ncbi:MAG: heavy-metal-associated domain-containing protein [Alphaproteobacteria bacterium]|nr:heavy-metal-associated domain-containing protein [Alphaproteobacteria bacterium]
MKYILTIFALMITTPAFAAEECNALDVKVTGLVCDFCARSIEKTFGKREEVEDVKVDLDAGNIHLVLKAGQKLEEAELKQLITNAGYDMISVEKGCPNE